MAASMIGGNIINYVYEFSNIRGEWGASAAMTYADPEERVRVITYYAIWGILALLEAVEVEKAINKGTKNNRTVESKAHNNKLSGKNI